MTEAAERTLEIDELRHRWLERGEGPVAVLVHGIPTSPALWRHVIPELRGARLIAWEMIGYGLSHSTGAGRDISVEAQAGYLRRLLHALGVGRAVLVGHDLGGGVVQIAAVEEPSLCAGLVLTNSIAYDSWPIPSIKLMRMLGPGVARTPTALFRRVFAAFIAQGHDDSARARESAAAHWPGYDHPTGAATFVRQIRSLRTSDTLEVAPRLPGLRLPAGVVWGAADRFQKVSYAERLARDLGADLEKVDRGKHFMPEDHPQEVAETIRKVLERGA
ncbi:MAG TPA: alpha/beta hydrolase [Thermoleophilaceae bacterium]|nr:alpha/beta hydrolase [Thermoleophilaceae bacterium]